MELSIKPVMGLETLRRCKGRNPNGYFEDLPPDVRFRAWSWLSELLERRRRRGKDTPPWVFAILVGQAKRLALNPPTSAWGRVMLAKRGGYAVQRRYRMQGRQPTAIATRVRVLKQQRAKQRAATPGQQSPAGSRRQPTVFFNLPIGF